MLRFGPTARLIITAVLAVWLPVCCCEASGLVRAAWGAVASLVGEGGDAGCCCCSDHEREDGPAAPADRDCGDGCCARAVKVTGEPRLELPSVGPLLGLVVLFVEPMPAAAVRPVPPRPSPPPDCSLLRLHCALIV